MPRMLRAQKRLARFVYHVDNRLNPIMAKEMYQSVHSKAFISMFWILAGGPLLVYVLAWASASQSMGRDMFTALFILTGLVGMVLLPFSTFFSLRGQIQSHTIELVHVTGLGSGRLVWGYMLATSMRLLLGCSVLAPFITLCYMFGGIDVAAIISYTYLLLLFSLAMCALAVSCAAMTCDPNLRLICPVIFIVLLGTTIFWGLPVLLQSLDVLVKGNLGFMLNSNFGEVFGGILLVTVFILGSMATALNSASKKMAPIRGTSKSSYSLFSFEDGESC